MQKLIGKHNFSQSYCHSKELEFRKFRFCPKLAMSDLLQPGDTIIDRRVSHQKTAVYCFEILIQNESEFVT